MPQWRPRRDSKFQPWPSKGEIVFDAEDEEADEEEAAEELGEVAVEEEV